MDASDTSLETHVPPVVAFVNGMVVPTQTAEGPDMAAGSGFTVTITEVLQPVPSV